MNVKKTKHQVVYKLVALLKLFSFFFQKDKSLAEAVQQKTRSSTKNVKPTRTENRLRRCVSVLTFFATKQGNQLIPTSYLSSVQQCSVFYSIAASMLFMIGCSHLRPALMMEAKIVVSSAPIGGR